MSIHFQPKIIIGSLVGFIATIIGVIAVFFPSLFNLETKKISEYTVVLKNKNDYVNFINFLKDNEEKFVHLDITYFENERFSYKENYYYQRIPLDEEIDHNYSGDKLYGEIDKEGHFFVASKFDFIGPYMQGFNRKVGGFGIWLKEPGDDRSKDKNYLVVIPKDSDGNTLYKWNMTEYAHKEEMKLTGYFFVESPIEWEKYNVDTPASMSKEWEEESCEGDGCYDVFVIQLNPISKKELEFKKY